MIRHIVLIKLCKTESPGEHAATIDSIQSKIAGLKNELPQIISFSVGVNLNENGFHVCMDSVFENRTDLKTYLDNPIHRGTAAYIQKVSEDLTVFDYELWKGIDCQ